MSVDVSVVVPVYNPGSYLEACITGILGQSMSPDRLEVIFVDDGSTDESPERLDELSAAHPHIRVFHQPNSGWPGQPRNLGIDSANGEFVFFHDHDDQLGPEALERMVAMARRTGADVLIPKMVSRGRPVPRQLFRKNIEQAVLGKDPVVRSGTPHKMFRRDFLNRHGLRYPEGKRRLEDAVFVMAAYLLADVISVLGDYPCYYRFGREDKGNAALGDWDPPDYFGYVGEIVDVIDAHTEPGPLRDALYVRPYTGKMLSKLSGKRARRWDPERRQQIFDEVRRLALERFPADFHEQLQIVPRAHARALVADRLDQMMDVAARTEAVTARATAGTPQWGGDRWFVELEAELFRGDGSPIHLLPAGDQWQLDPQVVPVELSGTYDERDVRSGSLDVVLTHRRQRVEWFAPCAVSVELMPIPGAAAGARRLVLRGRAEIEPTQLAGGDRLGVGRWEVNILIRAFGMERETDLEVGSEVTDDLISPAIFGSSAFMMSPTVIAKNDRSKLLFTVSGIPQRNAAIAAHTLTVELASKKSLVITTDVKLAPSASLPNLAVVLVDSAGRFAVHQPVKPTPGAERLVLACDLAKIGRLPSGRLRIAVQAGNGVYVIGRADVGGKGRIEKVKRREGRPKRVKPPGRTADSA